MRYEVIEQGGAWIVRHAGEEVARFEQQVLALDEVARRLREVGGEGAASLSVRYQARSA